MILRIFVNGLAEIKGPLRKRWFAQRRAFWIARHRFHLIASDKTTFYEQVTGVKVRF
jgi:hypothetical protein